MTRQKIEGTLYRDYDLRAAKFDDDGRTITLSASSEEPYLRQSFFSDPWIEVLGHKRTEVDLSRLNGAAPVLYNHQRTREDRIGGVLSASLKDRRTVVQIKFSARDSVSDIRDDVKDGILNTVSIGYRINERKLTREGSEGEPDEYRVTSWTPMEVSMVDIPADATVGHGRSEDMLYRVIDLPETHEMKFDTDGTPIPETDADRQAIADGTATRQDGSPYKAPKPKEPAPVASNVTDLDDVRSEAERAGREAERTRCNEIRALFQPFGDSHADLQTRAIEKDYSVDETRKQLLSALGKQSEPAGGDAVRIETDSADKFRQAAVMTINVRAGQATDDERREVGKTGLRGYTLFEMARACVEQNGINTRHLSKMEVVGRAFTTSDFANILKDAANVSMLRGFNEAPETWNMWCNTMPLSDFKASTMVNLSSFSDLTLVNEGGEYKYGSFVDNGETIQLATYGKLFAISRQAIINDQLAAFTRIPRDMGRAGSRTVGDLAYAVLTSNPTMSDGNALFSAAHNNLNVSGTGGTPLTADAAGIAALEAMDTAMGTQTDASGNATALNITPGVILVSRAKRLTGMTLMSDSAKPGATHAGQSNPVQGLAEVVSDARLDADSASAYYLIAGKEFDTVNVGFLDGNEQPYLEEKEGWSVDGVEYKVRIDVAAAAAEWRTMQKDAGT